MEDTLMQFVVIIAIIIGLPVLITLIRQRFFSDKPSAPSEETDLLNNPISHAMPEEAHEPDETTIPIYKLKNLVEAGALKALLEEHGIDCMVHSFTDYAYGDIWHAQKGWGVLKVLAKDQARAEDLIDAFLEANDQADESTPHKLAQETPIPADKPAFPGIIFTVALVILLAIGALIVVAIFSAYRESGRKLAKEGYNYSINNEYDKAIEYYDKAISRWYREYWVYYNRGYDKAEKGDYAGAISDYTKAIKLKPDYVDAYNNRGYARYRKGDLDNAIKDYDKVIELNPKYEGTYVNRVLAKHDKGDYVGSLMDCEQAIKINPRDAMAWVNKGAALNSLGRYDEALKALEISIKLNSKDDLAWDNKGYALGQLGRHEEALEAFNKSIELNPKSDYAWNEKGYTLSKLGRYEESLKVLDKAIELDPKSVYAWGTKGYVLGKLSRYEESFKAFDKTIALNPKNAVIWYARACVYSFRKDKQNILEDLKKALRLEAKFKADAKKDDDFKWLWDDVEFKKITE